LLETVDHIYFGLCARKPFNACRINELISYLYGTKVALLLKESAPDCLPQTFRTAQLKDVGSTMRRYNRLLYSSAKVLIMSGIALVLSGTPVQAQALLSGTYICVSVEIAGRTHHCSAPSLEMYSDGSYQILAEHGTYEILKGHWLILSANKNHGKARLDGSKKIIFEFVSGGKKSIITYRRKYQRPPAWVSG
jgi:hypothetical protein